jgi:PKD repeat protein
LGNGTNLNLNTQGDSVNTLLNFSTSNLSAGFHKIYFRYKNNLGSWGPSGEQLFFVIDTNFQTVNNNSSPLKYGEYYFDTDPGFGNGTSFPVNSLDTINVNLTLQTQNLAVGFHKAYFRVKNQLGVYSNSAEQLFYIYDTTKTIAQTSLPKIIAMEYFFDQLDPGAGNASPFSIFSSNDSVNIPQLIQAIDPLFLDPLPVGVHMLNVRAKDESGNWSMTYSTSFTICDQPATANFNYQVNGTSVTFTNTSIKDYGTKWIFGDGSSSTSRDAIHNYGIGGQIRVGLISYSGCGNDTAWQIITLNCVSPTASFTKSISDLRVSFTAPYYLGATYSWNFGNGKTSTLQNPVAIFQNTGTFNVCLTISTSCGSSIYCENVNVSCAAPVSSFTTDVNGYTVNLTNNSTNAFQFIWQFGDATTNNTDFNAVKQYASTGTYNIKLIVQNGCGTNQTTKSVTINCISPSSNFDFVTSGLQAELSNTSLNGTSWLWDFGDGTTSPFKNPSIHSFPNTGTYNVCLKAINNCGADSICKDVYVCTGPSANFSYTTSGLNINLTDLSLNSENSFWTFGDGNGTNLNNPTYTYNSLGNYNVCLEATNSCGTNSLCKNISTTCSEQSSQEVCQATVEGLLAKRYEVYWEKPNTTSIDSFVVYRKITSTQYQRIGATSYNLPSVFTDLQILAGTQAQTYKVSLKDTCGIESPLSNVEHTTVHVVVDFTASNEPRLTFNEYQGRAVSYYRILRSTLGIPGLDSIGAIAGGILPTYQYVDLTAPSADSVWYRVETIWQDGGDCNPDRARIATSRSNIKNVNTRITKLNQQQLEKGFIVYPNPASNTLNISIEQNMRENITVRLFDMQGKMILEQNEEAKGYFQTQVGLSNLASGVYQLQIQTEGSILNYKIIKQ